MSKPWFAVAGVRQGGAESKKPGVLAVPRVRCRRLVVSLDVLRLHLDQSPESLGLTNLIGARIDHSVLGGLLAAAIRLGRSKA